VVAVAQDQRRRVPPAARWKLSLGGDGPPLGRWVRGEIQQPPLPVRSTASASHLRGAPDQTSRIPSRRHIPAPRPIAAPLAYTTGRLRLATRPHDAPARGAWMRRGRTRRQRTRKRGRASAGLREGAARGDGRRSRRPRSVELEHRVRVGRCRR
jgi:hypothetical protein